MTSIPEMGALGLVYLLARAIGKFLGARLGARRLNMDPKVQQYLGFALMAQAGLAVGLMLTVEARYPEYGPIIKTVILSSVAIYEMFGPISGPLRHRPERGSPLCRPRRGLDLGVGVGA